MNNLKKQKILRLTPPTAPNKTCRLLLEKRQNEMRPFHSCVKEAYGPATTFAVSSRPSAFMTASVVFKVGLPFALNER